jgi:hypothetical protein
MILTIFVSGPKQPGDRIDVYLRPLVDGLKILWKPGVPKVWDEYKREEFTMHPCCSPPSTTTRLIATSLTRVKGKLQLAHTAWKILAQYGYDIQRNTYLWGTVISSVRNIHTGPWIVSLMGKRRIERRRFM